MSERFDFVIVGGGTSGPLLAARLSNTPAKPSVLLIEAGGTGLAKENRAPYQRFMNAFALPALDQGYTTVPQKGLNGREIPYQRGKGLGGSTMLNFLVYTRGPKEDWDRWALLVDDDEWGWKKANERFKRIESFEDLTEDEDRSFVDPKKESHGYSGGLGISQPVLEDDVRITMQAGLELGLPINLDNNSGYVMGVSCAQLSYTNGLRSTSEQAFLENQPSNLTVWTNTKVAKIIFDKQIAIGLETVDGKQVSVSKEVILTSGAIDTSKLLLLSGIGPEKELEDLDIPVVQNLPGVGKNARDHLQVIIVNQMKRSFSGQFEFALDETRKAAALREWTKSQTGPYTSFFGSAGIIYGKDESTYETDAFKTLKAETQEFIRKPEIPHWEIIFTGPLLPPSFEMTPDRSFSSNVIVQMNAASTGSIKLRSKDPMIQPLIDPNFLSNPYDRVTMIAAVRAQMRVLKTNKMKEHYIEPIFGPVSDTDEDIIAFIEETAGTLWHFSSTAMMGEPTNKGAVVDSHLKVFGIKGLRIADLSVCIFGPNAHTQAIAYLIGETAADLIIEEHSLIELEI